MTHTLTTNGGQAAAGEALTVHRTPNMICGLRVLHVIDRLMMGGTQNLLMRSIKELKRRGIESQVCVLSSAARTDDIYQTLVNPRYLDFAGDYRNPWALYRCGKRLRTVVDDVHPDIIHSYLWVSDFLSARAVSGTSATHISHIVDRRDWQASGRLIHRIRRSLTQTAMMRSRTRFLAVSQAAKDFACEHMQYKPETVTVAANGIDWEDFTDVRPESTRRNRLVMGTAGRIEHEKGHQYLLQAFAQIVDLGIPVELRITGEGPLKQELVSFVAARGLTNHVKFLGWVPSVQKFYQELDLFLVPSVNAEGLPTTILEAMASGCVVVASNVGGASEAIRHHVDGCLVQARDVEGLVEEITTIFNDSDSLSRMSNSARKRVRDHFTTERMVDAICETYAATRRATSG